MYNSTKIMEPVWNILSHQRRNFLTVAFKEMLRGSLKTYAKPTERKLPYCDD